MINEDPWERFLGFLEWQPIADYQTGMDVVVVRSGERFDAAFLGTSSSWGRQGEQRAIDQQFCWRSAQESEDERPLEYEPDEFAILSPESHTPDGRLMCNRARMSHEPETLRERFGAGWAKNLTPPNASLAELYSKSRAWVVRGEDGDRVIDVMVWDVLGGQAAWPMTNVRNLALPQ